MIALPSTMRVVEVSEPGGPEALVLRERTLPALPPEHVLIRVAAAGLNRADILQRRGVYPPPPGAPDYPGLEVSGTVVATSAPAAAGSSHRAAGELRIGDEVCALLQGGGYAEYCAAPIGQTLRVPSGVSLVDAAALPEAFFTVWSNIWDVGRLAAGETLLVHGGSSGIGVAAIQLARALGHRVLTTAGSDEKCSFCAGLGAQPAINYRSEDFVAVARGATGGRGVDVVLDMVAGEYVERNLDALAPGGRLVVIATQGGTRATVDMRIVMMKRLIVTGSMLRPQPVSFKQAIKEELRRRVWPLIESGDVRPVVDRIFPFDQAAAAHAYMESGAHMGKILLEIGAGPAGTGA
jgi:NADPH2:quinone reductase